MAIFDVAQIEFAACICAYGRFALGITHHKPDNNKCCTYSYWSKVINRLGTLYNVDAVTTNRALGRYHELIAAR